MMRDAFDRLMYRVQAEMANEKMQDVFESLGQGSHYTSEQKAYAFQLIEQNGIRATAKILRIPRRTLQRWCRESHVFVKRCPYWVYDWAERRRKRRAFWQRRGYY